jgi:predicted alpha/beta-hydrolase family hydrolase
VEEISIEVGSGAVTASRHGAGATTVILGHGAGGNRKNPFLRRLAERLAESGRGALLYNFPYSERRAGRPDTPGVLEDTTRRVGEFARAELGATRLVHGGKSMGGRIASQVVAKGAPAEALVFLGYPLHAPGRHDQLRDRHLDAIAAPMLFVHGTRDAFARTDLLDAVLARLSRATLHRIEDADHSFGVLKRTGRTPAQVEAEILGAVTAWLDAQKL